MPAKRSLGGGRGTTWSGGAGGNSACVNTSGTFAGEGSKQKNGRLIVWANKVERIGKIYSTGSDTAQSQGGYTSAWGEWCGGGAGGGAVSIFVLNDNSDKDFSEVNIKGADGYNFICPDYYKTEVTR